MYVLNGAQFRTQATLSGPGIDGSVEAQLPLPSTEVLERNVACGDWPLGVDLILINALGEVMALPRTTRIELAA